MTEKTNKNNKESIFTKNLTDEVIGLLTNITEGRYRESYETLQKCLCLTDWQTKNVSELIMEMECFSLLNTTLASQKYFQKDEVASYIPVIEQIANYLCDKGLTDCSSFNLIARCLTEQNKPLEAITILINKLLLPTYRSNQHKQLLKDITSNILIAYKRTTDYDKLFEHIYSNIIPTCRNTGEKNSIKLILVVMNKKIERFYEASRLLNEEILPSMDPTILEDRIRLQVCLIDIYIRMNQTYITKIIPIIHEIKSNYPSVEELFDEDEQEVIKTLLQKYANNM